LQDFLRLIREMLLEVDALLVGGSAAALPPWHAGCLARPLEGSAAEQRLERRHRPLMARQLHIVIVAYVELPDLTVPLHGDPHRGGPDPADVTEIVRH